MNWSPPDTAGTPHCSLPLPNPVTHWCRRMNPSLSQVMHQARLPFSCTWTVVTVTPLLLTQRCAFPVHQLCSPAEAVVMMQLLQWACSHRAVPVFCESKFS